MQSTVTTILLIALGAAAQRINKPSASEGPKACLARQYLAASTIAFCFLDPTEQVRLDPRPLSYAGMGFSVLLLLPATIAHAGAQIFKHKAKDQLSEASFEVLSRLNIPLALIASWLTTQGTLEISPFLLLGMLSLGMALLNGPGKPPGPQTSRNQAATWCLISALIAVACSTYHKVLVSHTDLRTFAKSPYLYSPATYSFLALSLSATYCAVSSVISGENDQIRRPDLARAILSGSLTYLNMLLVSSMFSGGSTPADIALCGAASSATMVAIAGYKTMDKPRKIATALRSQQIMFAGFSLLLLIAGLHESFNSR